MQATTVSLAQRQQLRDHGYVILQNVLSQAQVDAAKSIITAALPEHERRLLVPAAVATHPDVIGLFQDSNIASILADLMGPFPPVISCQVAVTPGHDDLGGAPVIHVDGGWSSVIPTRADAIDPSTHRPKDAAPYYGANDEVRGNNDGLLWMDPQRRISNGSYTALVGICLSDQSQPGNGQFGVLKGLHEDVEKVFQRQRDSGGVIGAEGVDWPRIKIDARERPFCNGLPDSIRALGIERGKANRLLADWPWPELTPVLMEPGDAVITLHSLPHTPTPNFGPNPRINVYFRIRRLRPENPHEGSRRVAHGVSDHPDRGYFGQYLDYPDNYDPWQTSIDRLCDHWSEWDGMQDLLPTDQSTNA
jgi:hypothetical protein